MYPMETTSGLGIIKMKMESCVCRLGIAKLHVKITLHAKMATNLLRLGSIQKTVFAEYALLAKVVTNCGPTGDHRCDDCWNGQYQDQQVKLVAKIAVRDGIILVLKIIIIMVLTIPPTTFHLYRVQRVIKVLIRIKKAKQDVKIAEQEDMQIKKA